LIKHVEDAISLEVNEILESIDIWKRPIDKELKDRPEVKRLEYMEKELETLNLFEENLKRTF
jgi:hypothetical protein